MLVLVAAAMLLVRIGWSGRRKIAAIGWVAVVGALIALTVADGAWGLAIGAVVAMVVALILHAGWIAPTKTRRASREALSITIPRHRRDLVRRMVVFVIIVPGAFAAAQWLALGVYALARRGGVGEADATVLALFLQPTLWAGLMAVQLTRTDPVRMIVAPAVASQTASVLTCARLADTCCAAIGPAFMRLIAATASSRALCVDIRVELSHVVARSSDRLQTDQCAPSGRTI